MPEAGGAPLLHCADVAGCFKLDGCRVSRRGWTTSDVEFTIRRKVPFELGGKASGDLCGARPQRTMKGASAAASRMPTVARWTSEIFLVAPSVRSCYVSGLVAATHSYLTHYVSNTYQSTYRPTDTQRRTNRKSYRSGTIVV